MTQTATDLKRTFAHSWELLTSNWVLIVPGIVIAVLAAAVQVVFTVAVLGSFVISGNGSPDALMATKTFVAILVLLITIGFSLVQMAYVTGMAGGAWLHGKTTLADGWAALSHRLLPLVAAAALLFLIGLCAAVLSTVTFGVPLAVYAIFFIYTMASLIIGDRGPVDAITESCRLALANIWPTVAVVAMIVVMAIVGAAAGSLVGKLSDFSGWLVAGVLQQVIVAYASLVVAGEYLKLTNRTTE